MKSKFFVGTATLTFDNVKYGDAVIREINAFIINVYSDKLDMVEANFDINASDNFLNEYISDLNKAERNIRTMSQAINHYHLKKDICNHTKCCYTVQLYKEVKETEDTKSISECMTKIFGELRWHMLDAELDIIWARLDKIHFEIQEL